MAFLKKILQHPFGYQYKTLISVWILMVVISVGLHMHNFNNFLIYKFTFWHAYNGTSLYAAYPEDHYDLNHYGPIFSLIMAPFAIIPSLWVGVFVWHLVLALFLWWAIRCSTLTWVQQVVVYWFIAHEMLNALGMSQFNVATAAMILLSYTAINKGKDMWGAFWIVLGTLVKMYGIVGLAFIFFSKNKSKFLMWLVVWTAILVALPMPFFGVQYELGQYIGWMNSLIEKGGENVLSDFQNISLLGFVRKIGYASSMGLDAYYDVFWRRTLPDASNWWMSSWNDLWLILPGLCYGALPYLRFGQYKNYPFQMMCLASVLMFANIFSTGSENSSYIISMLGVAIWYVAVPWKRTGIDLALLIFCFLLTSLSPTDLFPEYLRTHWIRPFALKSIPVVIIWIKLIYEMLTRDYVLEKSTTDDTKEDSLLLAK